MEAQIEPTADVAEDATIGPGSLIWHLAQIREGAVLGANCTVGRGAYVGAGVRVGNNVKIQNYALVYEPATLEDGVFVGPAVVFTNDQFPRSVHADGSLKDATHWAAVGVSVAQGASIGARAVCVAPLAIGSWAMIAAGAVVVRDVPAHALVAGVPARQIGWVGAFGHRLVQQGESWVCPVTGQMYTIDEGVMGPG